MDDDQSSILLPEDVIAEILVRLHIKPLFRFKLVSIQWKSIISDPKFAQYYLQRARSSPKSSASWRHWGILFTSLNYCDEPCCLPSNDRDFSKPVSNIHDIDQAPLSLYESVFSTYTSWKHKNLHEILASSNGLVLSRLPPTSYTTIGEHNNFDKWSLELCVFNPLTKQSVKLPLLWVPYYPQAFGLATRAAQQEGENPAYITYKVVVIRSARYCVNYANPTNFMTIMIFSSDTGRWTRKDLISCPTSILMSTVMEAFTCRGILHWLHCSRRILVTYDPCDSPDRFGCIRLPNKPGNMLIHSGMHLMHSGHEDLLKFAEVERCSEFDMRLHVWCLAVYAKGEWCLEQTFPVSPLWEDGPSWVERSLNGCSKLIAPDPWNDHSFCILMETGNMVKAVDLGSAEVVYADPAKVMAETGYWMNTLLLVHISLCPWSSPFNAQARSNTSSEIGFRKISAVWFPS